MRPRAQACEPLTASSCPRVVTDGVHADVAPELEGVIKPAGGYVELQFGAASNTTPIGISMSALVKPGAASVG